MAIKGSLKEASLPDVLQLLAMGGKTGCLSVTDRSSFGYIYFENGRIIYASLLNRRDRLGDILIQEGIITRDALEEAIDEQSRSRDGRRLGEILQESGTIDEETLQRYIRHQIEEAVYHLFTWNQGTFYFEPGQRPEEEPILVSINPESLLLEGARRVDEWSQIETKVPSFDLIFEVDEDKAEAFSKLDLTEDQKRILPKLDGVRTAADVVEETALPEFEVGKALYGLISAGLIRRAGKRETEPRRQEGAARVDEHRNLGVAFYKTTMFDEAEREFNRVLELEPDAGDALFYLGLVSMRKSDPQDAAERFRGLLDRDAQRPAVFNNLALALEQQGKTEEALGVLDEGMDVLGEQPHLLLSKAVLHLKAGDPGSAMSALDRYQESVDGVLPPLFYSTRALAAAMTGDLDGAVETIGTAVDQHESSVALLNNAGVILERKGDIDRAHELYEQAYAEEPGLPQVSKNLGDLLYRSGAYEEAAQAYERALRVDSDLGDDVYAKLGNVYYKRRDREKAMSMWTRALELNPENEVVRTNLELVEGAADDS